MATDELTEIKEPWIIVYVLGGPQKAAELLIHCGIRKRNTVWNWSLPNRLIPPKYYLVVNALLEPMGYTAHPSAFGIIDPKSATNVFRQPDKT